MKLLFVHDHQFVVNKNNVYSDKLPYHAWKRYLNVFDNIQIWGRKFNGDRSVDSLPKSSGKNVTFNFGKNISGLRSFFNTRSHERHRLNAVIKKTDCLMIRLPSEYGYMALKIAQRIGKPYGIEVVGCAWDAYWNYGSLQAKLYAPLAYYRMKKAVSDSDYTIYVSKHFLQTRYPPKKNATVTNISNVEMQQPSDDVLSGRLKRIKSAKRTITFGTIGSLKSKYKGVHIAIKALNKMESENFEYRVLGKGDTRFYSTTAKKYGIEEKVKFDGNLPSGFPVFEWLDKIDIYVHPSFQEGLPRAVIEAMSRGCPVLASTAGGTPELIDEKWLHKPGDYKKLGRQIIEMAGSQDSMLEQARVNFETSKKYSINKLEKKRDRILRQLRSLAEQEK